MDQVEVGELIDCALCGGDISLGRDCAYAMVGSALCFSCAVCRGGVYDDARRMWSSPPDVTGLDRPLQTQRAPKRYWSLPVPRPVFYARADAAE